MASLTLLEQLIHLHAHSDRIFTVQCMKYKDVKPGVRLSKVYLMLTDPSQRLHVEYSQEK